MVICHREPSGQMQELELPIPAARAHLRQHPRDTEGPCPRPVVDEPPEPARNSGIVSETPTDTPDVEAPDDEV